MKENQIVLPQDAKGGVSIGGGGMKLGEKADKSIELIKEYAPYADRAGGYVVGFSGGKDSAVVYQLFTESGVPFRAVYNVTTNDPPESVRFIRREYPNVEFVLPKLNFFKLAEKNKMLPTMIVRYCCAYFKESYKGFMALGVRKEESTKRAGYDVIMLNNKAPFCKETYKGEHVRFYPILEWTEADVWEFIEDRQLPINPVYDTFGRVGCMLCPFLNKKSMLYWLGKYPKLRTALLKTIQNMIDNGSYNKYHPTAKQVLEWWMSKENYDKYFTQLKLEL